jgi:hypothetical protein
VLSASSSGSVNSEDTLKTLFVRAREDGPGDPGTASVAILLARTAFQALVKRKAFGNA